MNTTTPIEYYRTRDGRKAVVFPEFSTSKTTKGFIKGDNNHIWHPHIWERQSDCSGAVFHSDLLEPWTDELNFDASCLPKWANKWIAMTRNGAWRCFGEKPELHSDGWDHSIGFANQIYPPFTPKNVTCDWKDSLHQIVDGKAVKV